jgi:hypothetical protein
MKQSWTELFAVLVAGLHTAASQNRLESPCGCGVDFAPVCCWSATPFNERFTDPATAANGYSATFATLCDAECDVRCNTSLNTTTIESGPCADSESQGRVGGDDDLDDVAGETLEEFRLIPGYSFHMRNSMCNARASYFGPSGSGVSMDTCLLGCSSVADCMFVTYTRSGFCRYW